MAGGCDALARLALACVGCAGGHVLSSAGARGEAGGRASSSGAQLAEFLRVGAPLQRLLLQSAAAAQASAHGDGALLAALVAARLAHAAREQRNAGAEAGVARALRGHQRALAWCRALLGAEGAGKGAADRAGHGAACLASGGAPCAPARARAAPPADCSPAPLPVAAELGSDAASLLAVARGVLAPKRVAALSCTAALERVASLCVRAFVSSLAEGVGACVRPVTALGCAPQESQCLPDTLVLNRVAAPSYQARRAIEALGARLAGGERTDAAHVLLFSCALGGARMAARYEEDAEAPAATAATGAAPAAGERWDDFRAFAAACRAAGAALLACQRTIHPLLQEALLEAGVAPLERVSARHTAALARMSGATPVAAEAPIDEEAWRAACGALGAVAVRPLSQGDSRRVVILRPPTAPRPRHPRAAPVATLLLCSPDEGAADELAAVADAAIKVLRTAVTRPRAIAGGGYCEAALAAAVRARADAERRTAPLGRAGAAARADAAAACQLAEALEAAAQAIARPAESGDGWGDGGAAGTITDANAARCAAAAAGDVAGVPIVAARADTCALGPVATYRRDASSPLGWAVAKGAYVLDLAEVKLSALELGVEAAATAARITHVIAGCDV